MTATTRFVAPAIASEAPSTRSPVRARLGSDNPIDLLMVERTLVQAETDLASSDSALVDDAVSVFKALGGGWQ